MPDPTTTVTTDQGPAEAEGGAGAPALDRSPARPRRRRVLQVMAVVVGVFVVLVVAGGLWLRNQIDPGTGTEEVQVEIPMGSSTGQIGRLLEAQGVIGSATVFEYYTRWKGAGPFEAGVYDGLHTPSSMDAVLARLSDGPLPPPYTEVPIPEGLWLSQIRARVLELFPAMSADELDQALASIHSTYQSADAPSLEGFLFPATYRVEKADEADEAELVQQMVTTFDSVAAEIDLAAAPDRLAGVAGRRRITPYDVVIVASMIEEEAGTPEEKSRIARVIYNRLAQGMPLGIDATVIYALGEHTEELTRSQLEIDSPYNTRRFAGLPPGPIASPGRDSLVAALNPAEGDWLYYVLANEDGSHYFTADYDDFMRVQAESRARGLF